MNGEDRYLTQRPAGRQSQENPDGNGRITIAGRYSGPIPHPTILSRYDEIVPGAAERIIQMAEKNQQHQIKQETRALTAKRWEVHVGQIAAVIVIFAAFSVAAYALYQGATVAASVIGGSTVVGLALAFMAGRRSTTEATQAQDYPDNDI